MSTTHTLQGRRRQAAVQSGTGGECDSVPLGRHGFPETAASKPVLAGLFDGLANQQALGKEKKKRALRLQEHYWS